MADDANADDCKYIWRVVIVGDSGVGKSGLLKRFTDNTFSHDTKSTIGVDFADRTLTVSSGDRVRAQIWDTAGQERYRGITQYYYRGAKGALVVYDVTSRESFQDVEYWLSEVQKHAAPEIVTLLIGNKCDLRESREVTVEEAAQFAQTHSISYLETSALDATNVDRAFQLCIEEIFKRVPDASGASDDDDGAGEGKSAVAKIPAAKADTVDISKPEGDAAAKGGCKC
eukprot:GILI01035426.1.p1 GENE.GILI01035426.1~~GILI01035426.1.p1  ORF type:complete len:228 (+),score=54.63 GILI01035426.1:45-728(+)